ncbi:MAG TPA: protease complex subunit PrcB family protein [Gemmatimonadales bacterium]|nr:protease complex subunit PrcB family protein [Gemmatimonadales bacterium]
MAARIHSLVLLSVLALLGACQDTVSPPFATLGNRVAVAPTAVLTHEYYSGIGDQALFVIADSASLTSIWRQLYMGSQPQPPIPAVDFRTERVLLAALGQRPTGGYDIQIDSVVQYELGIAAYVRAVAPGQSCGTTSALTQPVALVRVSPPVLAPIVFKQQAVVHECS